MSNNDIGIIQEQGFVTGNGLGFKPLSESEKKSLEDKIKDLDPERRKKLEKMIIHLYLEDMQELMILMKCPKRKQKNRLKLYQMN